MVNRALQAKRLKASKQKRMRRAYLKTYSASIIHVGQSIDKSKIPRGAEGVFDYRQRGNTYWEPFLERKFPSRGMISKERQLVLEQLAKATEDVDPKLNVVLERRGITKTIIKLYFSPDYKVCFFMKEDYFDMVMLKSGYYGSKERAMWAYNNGKINWLERIEFASLSSEAPPALDHES